MADSCQCVTKTTTILFASLRTGVMRVPLREVGGLSEVMVQHLEVGPLDKLQLKLKVGRELADHQDMCILLSWFCHLLLCDLGQVSWPL